LVAISTTGIEHQTLLEKASDMVVMSETVALVLEDSLLSELPEVKKLKKVLAASL